MQTHCISHRKLCNPKIVHRNRNIHMKTIAWNEEPNGYKIHIFCGKFTVIHCEHRMPPDHPSFIHIFPFCSSTFIIIIAIIACIISGASPLRQYVLFDVVHVHDLGIVHLISSHRSLENRIVLQQHHAQHFITVDAVGMFYAQRPWKSEKLVSAFCQCHRRQTSAVWCWRALPIPYLSLHRKVATTNLNVKLKSKIWCTTSVHNHRADGVRLRCHLCIKDERQPLAIRR